ncbi:DNA repair protein RadC [Lachnospiraceae bacterium PFB1-21]
MGANELEIVNIRLIKEPSLYSDELLTSPDAVLRLMSKELSTYDREVLCILNMKTNNQVINMNVVSVGSLNAGIVSPREVFKSSILSNAAAIIAIHNHPSSNTQPSRDDIKITERLSKCGDLLGIELLDHIIIAGETGKMYSFKKEGKLGKSGRINDEICR